MAFQLSSPDIVPNGTIPAKFTCDGSNVSPPLRWKDLPSGTKSLALIVDDPDAPRGTWNHWILFNIPASATELPEAAQTLPAGTVQGNTSFGKTGYGGPCPPDREHRYFFKLYALDQDLPLSSGAKKADLETAMKGHVLGQAELMGRYDRPRH